MDEKMKHLQRHYQQEGQQRFQFCSFESLAIFPFSLAIVYEFTVKNIFLNFFLVTVRKLAKIKKKQMCHCARGFFSNFVK
jgi:hypothetical protein